MDQQWKNTKWNVAKNSVLVPILRSFKTCSKLMIKHGMKQHVTRVKVDDKSQIWSDGAWFLSWGLCRVIVFPLDKASVMCIRVHIYLCNLVAQDLQKGWIFRGSTPFTPQILGQDLKESNLPLKRAIFPEAPLFNSRYHDYSMLQTRVPKDNLVTFTMARSILERPNSYCDLILILI